MALSSSSSWFQSWSTPSQIFPEQYYRREHHVDHAYGGSKLYSWDDDSHRFGHAVTYNKPSTSSNNMANIFPYLLTLGLINGEQTHQQAKPLTKSQPILERTGPFTTWYSWKQIDFAYSSEAARSEAIGNGDFVIENNLPLGIEVHKDRLFVSFPKWKDGVPATLAVLPKVSVEQSPKLVPYPSWDWHNTGSCEGLTSVYRMQADECNRLWVIDSGQIDVTIEAKQVCPPQIFIFDLKTDKLILRYPLPKEFIKQDSLYSNIKVDIRQKRCEDAHAYVTDVWRFGLVVFSLRKMRSWRVTDHLFYPDPLAASYNLNGLEFEWTDGIFGMALSPEMKRSNDRLMYFHPMSSFREFFVKTSIIRNETGWDKFKDSFQILGQSRGKSGHASASAMDRNGILLFNQVTRNSIACWDSRKPYRRDTLDVIAYSNETLVFPNDLKIDNEKRQSVWIISNRLPVYLYSDLDAKDVNFRIMSAFVDEAIKDTICNPKVLYNNLIGNTFDDECN